MDRDDITLQMAISRFRELRAKHGHLPRQGRTPRSLLEFHAAQVEMFNIAQMICSLVDPGLQLDLDTCRREIIQQIELNIKVPTGARVVTRRITNSNLIWSEFQLTPEISVDPGITGNAVLFPFLRRLKALLRAQVGLVNTKVYG